MAKFFLCFFFYPYICQSFERKRTYHELERTYADFTHKDMTIHKTILQNLCTEMGLRRDKGEVNSS